LKIKLIISEFKELLTKERLNESKLKD